MSSNIKKPMLSVPRSADMAKWACVACDQFTSEPLYWKKLEDYVGDAPSTLKLIIPEVNLNENLDDAIEHIEREMDVYIKNGFLRDVNSYVLVEREVEDGKKRVGIMVEVDLDAYDWRRVRVPIRATEDTIVERLPARIALRRAVPLELPHTLLIIDDKDKNIIEPIYAARASFEKLYDFDTNMNGGHITGYVIPDRYDVAAMLDKLNDPETQRQRYGTDAGIQIAVGDGNHSIASAKAYWEEMKTGLTAKERETHPARFFLAEVVNLYGEGMEFKPINRLMVGGNPEEIINELKKNIGGEGRLKLLTASGESYIACPARSGAAIKAVQEFVGDYIKRNGSVTVDYVHNESHLQKIVNDTIDALGIVMPVFDRNELFDYVVNVGNLPKKAFSIGEPEHKRYYLESRFIK